MGVAMQNFMVWLNLELPMKGGASGCGYTADRTENGDYLKDKIRISQWRKCCRMIWRIAPGK